MAATGMSRIGARTLSRGGSLGWSRALRELVLLRRVSNAPLNLRGSQREDMCKWRYTNVGRVVCAGGGLVSPLTTVRGSESFGGFQRGTREIICG